MSENHSNGVKRFGANESERGRGAGNEKIGVDIIDNRSSVHEIRKIYFEVAIKAMTLLVAIVGGIAGYILLDRHRLALSEHELESQRVKFMVQLAQESDLYKQKAILTFLRSVYPPESGSRMEIYVSAVEEAINERGRRIDLNKAGITVAQHEISKELDSGAPAKEVIKKHEATIRHLSDEIMSLREFVPVLAGSMAQATASQALVAIDVGHSSEWPGQYRENPTLSEETYTKTLADDLVAELAKLGLKAVVIHGGSHKERATRINNTNAKLVVSLHLNGFDSETVSGSEVLVAPNASASTRLMAENLLQICVDILGTKKRGVKTLRSTVLTNAKMPAFHLELFFLTNNRDALAGIAKKNQLASALAAELARSVLPPTNNNDDA